MAMLVLGVVLGTHDPIKRFQPHFPVHIGGAGVARAHIGCLQAC
jgi:hypothetical protein